MEANRQQAGALVRLPAPHLLQLAVQPLQLRLLVCCLSRGYLVGLLGKLVEGGHYLARAFAGLHRRGDLLPPYTYVSYVQVGGKRSVVYDTRGKFEPMIVVWQERETKRQEAFVSTVKDNTEGRMPLRLSSAKALRATAVW